MQYLSIDYSRHSGMEWLTADLQKWLHLASITSNKSTKELALNKIAELRVKL